MKKFKKPLLISVLQDDDRMLKSPSRMGNKQNRQKSLLLFNENTISSSVNNDDNNFHEQDNKLATGCEQFVEQHTREAYDRNRCPSMEIEQANNINRLQRSRKFNMIEFQQFMVDSDDIKSKQTSNMVCDINQKQHWRDTQKRPFSIQIPQQRQDRQEQMSIKYAFDLKNSQKQQSKLARQSGMKQPPAPSNKTSQKRGVNPRFVFPTSCQQSQLICCHNNSSLKQNKKQLNQKITSKKHIRHQQDTINSNNNTINNTINNNNINNQLTLKQLDTQWQQRMECLSMSFEKERQQFYKEKSRLEKELMIRDGQIEMLQKLITGKYSLQQKQVQQQQKITLNNNNSNSNNNNNNYGSKLSHSSKSQIASHSSSIIQKPNSLYISDDKVTAMQTILLEKDLRINTLLQRINQLNAVVEQRNTEVQDVRGKLAKSQQMNQSLRNQIFIHQKKDQSQKLTKQFYKVKQTLIQVQKTTQTPKGKVGKSKWQEDQQSLEKERDMERDMERQNYPFRGIDDLHKRLESLKMNRIELESRGRMKSQMNYSLTSKNKTKGTFDFKGKFYDREREFNWRGGGGY